MITMAAIAMGVVFAVCGYRWGFYTIWAMLFNLMISIYLGIMLSPTVAGFMPTLFSAGVRQTEGNFWYVYAAIVAGVALTSFIILQITAMTYFTGTFNISLPKLLENLGAMFVGFAAGYILWGFLCFLVLIMPIKKEQSILFKSFTADPNSKEISMPTISKVTNTINTVSLQPNRPQVRTVIKWTLGWETTGEPNDK
jgi:hypothetical protein